MNRIYYSDLDVALTKNPITNDIAKKTNQNSVKQSLKLLLLTSFYDRLWNPDVGSKLKDVMFSPFDSFTKTLLEREIRLLIEKYEPRVKIYDINVDETDRIGTFIIKMNYQILEMNQTDTFQYEINRIR